MLLNYKPDYTQADPQLPMTIEHEFHKPVYKWNKAWKSAYCPGIIYYRKENPHHYKHIFFPGRQGYASDIP